MLRLQLNFLLLAALVCVQVIAAQPESWHAYPGELPAFDYSGERLQQYWPQLTAASDLPFPDQAQLQALLQRYPKLQRRMLELAQQPHAHPALKALAQQQWQPLADAMQQVWRLHFSGQFQQAYELGVQLGPVGNIPALYSRLMYLTLLEPNEDARLAGFHQVSEHSRQLLPLAPEHAFARFGLAYAQARTLELLSTSAAASSGLLDDTRERLQQLQQQAPQSALYPAALGGLHAGIVERVGSFVGRLTYGASADKAVMELEKASQLQPGLPVIHYEFARSLRRLDDSDYLPRIQQLLQQCQQLSVYSAEEALNQQNCHTMWSQVTAE
ncbi:hypothetical protein CHH28_08830 [Bacterioplanes sanyensis]|uniref:DUF4034 domain-containing protein n=1 Tax=Bacterioplanes sanyensis TaxID=1249553 RepID=A0A222FJ29_9GAMM|nr:hypothetical protein [Bacterioplanes sanyensis]ASP38780.1 hypothetical protein CHH28_08830 [Bacterioplanes sanyensis]